LPSSKPARPAACTVDEFGLAVKGRQSPTLPLVMRRVLVAVMVLAALAAACTATAAPRSVRTTGGDQISFIGDGSRVTFTGLASRTKVTETVTSTDINGVCWRLKTKTESDAAGAVAVDDSTYAAMSPVTSAPKGAYYWGDAPQDFKVTVAGVQRTVRRQLLQHTITETTVTSHGLSGTLYDAHLPGRHPAVLLIRGSAGGEPGLLLPSVIAGYGYPVLALAYFKAPGLPATLQNVRLEYFRSALEWMAAQPDIDAKHLFIHGTSRGGEAALLIGATFHHLVSGVIAVVPSSNVGCGYPDCSQPAWTLGGKPVPFTRVSGVTPPIDDPRAEIAVERITGPVLLSCGEQDQIWPSCTYAKAVVARRAAHHLPTALRDCAACDHDTGGGTVPGEAWSDPSEHAQAGRNDAVPFFTATLALLSNAADC